MAPGRTVPWCSWEEWQLVRNWLLSQSHNNIRRGIFRVRIPGFLLPLGRCDASNPFRGGRQAQFALLLLQVEAWRARGRVPLGVDITASLLETALCDPAFWGQAAASAAATAAAVAGARPGAASSVSQQQIRLQYSATIVRYAVFEPLAPVHAVVCPASRLPRPASIPGVPVLQGSSAR
jgi:hypothetical protein